MLQNSRATEANVTLLIENPFAEEIWRWEPTVPSNDQRRSATVVLPHGQYYFLGRIADASCRPGPVELSALNVKWYVEWMQADAALADGTPWPVTNLNCVFHHD